LISASTGLGFIEDLDDELKLVELIGREARPPNGDDCEGEMSGGAWIGGKKVDAVAVVRFGGLALALLALAFSLAGSWAAFVLLLG
jgi:hypothetical protein